MESIDPYMFLVDMALHLCSTVIKMAKNAKANKERCQHVAQRVKALEKLVLTIKNRASRRISDTVKNALRDLCSTLESAKELMVKFSKTTAFKGFLKSGSNEEKFLRVDKNLTDNLQVLQSALLIEHGDTLHKVYETVTGRRRPHTRPSAPMFQPSTMPPGTMSSPTAPNPFQNNMPTVTMSSPTTPFPFQNNMPTMTMYSPTTPFPFQNNMPIMTMSNPTTPTSFYYNMPTMTMSNPTSPTSVYMMPSMSPSPFSTTTTTIVSNSATNMMPQTPNTSVLTNNVFFS